MGTKYKYEIGEIVYLLTDVDRLPRMITGIFISPDREAYKLVSGASESYHYDIEITKDKIIYN